MFLIFQLPTSLSANKTLQNVLANVKSYMHPNWRYDITFDNREVIFHNPYQFYNDNSIIFLPYVKDNSIKFLNPLIGQIAIHSTEYDMLQPPQLHKKSLIIGY